MTVKHPYQQTLEEVVVARFVGATSGEASAGEKDDYARWVAADDARGQEADRLNAIAADLEVLRPHLARRFAVGRKDRRTSFRLRAIAAAAACLVAGLGYVVFGTHSIAADQGQPLAVTLASGIRIDLDVGAELSLPILPWPRHATLVRGEALFTVSHDESHPFRLRAGSIEIADIGTRFLVGIDGARTSVAVFEGSVALGSDGQEQQPLSSHQAAMVTNGAIVSAPMVDEDEAAGWSQGHIVFRNTPLSEVAARLSLYRRDKVRVGSPAIAELKVSGSFDISHQDAALSALEMALPVVAKRTVSDIVLLPVQTKAANRQPQ